MPHNFSTKYEIYDHSGPRGEKKGGGDGKDLESYPSLEWFTLPKALQIQGSLPLSVWNKNMPPNEMASLSLTDVVWWDLHIFGTKFSQVPDWVPGTFPSSYWVWGTISEASEIKIEVSTVVLVRKTTQK